VLAYYLTLGCTYAFAAAVQPGPFQTYLVSLALRDGWRRTLPAVLAPLLSDAPIILLVVLVLSRIPRGLEQGLRCAGGVFLLVLAWRAFAAWRSYGPAPRGRAGAGSRGVLAAASVNLLNPNPWLGWSLVMGPSLLAAWRASAVDGIALLVAFYGTMVAASVGIIVLFAAARRFGARVARALVGASAAALALLGCWQLWWGVTGLLGA